MDEVCLHTEIFQLLPVLEESQTVSRWDEFSRGKQHDCKLYKDHFVDWYIRWLYSHDNDASKGALYALNVSIASTAEHFEVSKTAFTPSRKNAIIPEAGSDLNAAMRSTYCKESNQMRQFSDDSN
jgi:hypothetical protein